MSGFASFTLAPARDSLQPAAPMMVGSPGTFRPAGVAAVWRGLAAASLLAFTACASLVPSPVPPALPEAEVAPAPIETPAPAPEASLERTLRVKASAFNCVRGQTDSSPSIGAWGDRLTPGMKAIAVSADLIELGLARGQRVRIHGLDGEYVVADRMSRRWERKIDIYMGKDVKAARHWGVREVDIIWTPEGN
jgi:3D (Asp-Asp-Asp) domain-containing protein